MRHSLIELLEADPIIPAIKDNDALSGEYTNRVVFLLCGDILNIPDIISLVHSRGKKAIVHADLINGLAPKEISVDYLAKCGADGIISTKPHLLKRAHELNLLTVLRIFALDSKSVSNFKKEMDMFKPDLVEVLPGTMPRVIEQLSQEVHIPLIAGGLISDKNDILSALNAGAIGVSTSNSVLWDL